MSWRARPIEGDSLAIRAKRREAPAEMDLGAPSSGSLRDKDDFIGRSMRNRRDPVDCDRKGRCYVESEWSSSVNREEEEEEEDEDGDGDEKEKEFGLEQISGHHERKIKVIRKNDYIGRRRRGEEASPSITSDYYSSSQISPNSQRTTPARRTTQVGVTESVRSEGRRRRKESECELEFEEKEIEIEENKRSNNIYKSIKIETRIYENPNFLELNCNNNDNNLLLTSSSSSLLLKGEMRNVTKFKDRDIERPFNNNNNLRLNQIESFLYDQREREREENIYQR